MAGLGPDAVRIIAETFAELVTGQTRETVGPAPDDDPIAHHLRVLDEKTAALIDTCARYAGMFSGAREEETAALRRYGRAVGMAFQISDDIIDISSTDSGKTPGTDLREGVRTLPVLYTLADPAADPRLRELVSGPITSEELREAVELLSCSPGHGTGAQDAGRLRRRRERRTRPAAGILVPGRDVVAGQVRHRPHPLRPRQLQKNTVLLNRCCA